MGEEPGIERETERQRKKNRHRVYSFYSLISELPSHCHLYSLETSNQIQPVLNLRLHKCVNSSRLVSLSVISKLFVTNGIHSVCMGLWVTQFLIFSRGFSSLGHTECQVPFIYPGSFSVCAAHPLPSCPIPYIFKN